MDINKPQIMLVLKPGDLADGRSLYKYWAEICCFTDL
jgi:hypothetical protein